MGFNTVYKALQDVFPQIDSRLLRAVAIEHSKDADLAVEVVLVEVIPHLSQHSQSQSSTSSFPNKTEKSPSITEVAVDGGKTLQLESLVFEQSTQAGPSSTPNANRQTDIVGNGSPIRLEKGGDKINERGHDSKHEEGLFGKIASCLVEKDFAVVGHVTKQPTSRLVSIPVPHSVVNKAQDPGSYSKVTSVNNAASVDEKVVNDNRNKGLFGQIAACLVENDPAVNGYIRNQASSEPKLPVTQQVDLDSSSKTTTENSATSVNGKGVDNNLGEGLFGKIAACLVENDPAVNGCIRNQASSQVVGTPEPTLPVTQELDPSSSPKTTTENNVASVHEKGVINNRVEGLFGQIAACLVKNDFASKGFVQERASSELVSNPEPHIAVTQEQDPGSSSKTTSEKDASVIEENTDDESIMTSKLTISDQVCSMELLEDIIEEARNEKKTLMSTMDSVVELMREVEDKEKAAEEAKEEATRDCSHIFAKVDELKQALGRAKEANDMHSGEVYAEKAILATEMKELQLRLFTLSDERNKSLDILNEMREALESRLATALKEIEAAEGKKLEKEKSAREALAYQESRLEKVVEESKKLKQVAEENSKLQEFLMDRGRAIDILQGEISVKCQDVMLLKEKFDKRISLSSSQTSSILAASSAASSFRSTATVTAEAEMMFETPKKSLDDSYNNKTPWSSEAQSHTESPLYRSGGQDKQSDAWKLLLNDDDWELFDKGELSPGA